jgi:hypothetical protein
MEFNQLEKPEIPHTPPMSVPLKKKFPEKKFIRKKDL